MRTADHPFVAALQAMKFPRMGGRVFLDFRHSSAREIDDKLIRTAWQNILGARSDTERNFFFDRCMHAYMDACDIFKDYTVLNYETGEVIHYDPPEADARLAHEETADYLARRMIGAAFSGASVEVQRYLLGKLYRLGGELSAQAVAAHALMFHCAADVLVPAISSGTLKREDLAHYREVSPEDDIVSRLLREGRHGDEAVRQALAVIDEAAGIDWDGPLSLWPFAGYSDTVTLHDKATDKGLLPAGRQP
ncbi:MAG: hypothetical protein JSR42_16930 [Proteobacteria bacterium]|nr:hypothetical protein [Pseudomonadota bacterium]